MSLLKEIESTIRENWDSPALTDYGSDITLTYGEIARQVAYLHVFYEALGIKPGDKIAICSRNSSNWVIASLSVVTYGGVLVPLLPEYSDSQLREICEHCEAKFMIGAERLRGLWPEGCCPMYLINIDDMLTMTPTEATDQHEFRVIDEYMSRYPKGYGLADLHYIEENPDDMMLLCYTSGSTGKPKGVMLSYRSALINACFLREKMHFRRGMRHLVVLPFAHSYGLLVHFVSSILNAFHLVILTRPPVASLVQRALAEVQPERFFSVPLVLEKIVGNKSKAEIEAALGGHVEEIVVAGAPMGRDTEARLLQMGIPFTMAYGMTEAGPFIAYSSWREHRLASTGKIPSYIEAKVLSNDPQNAPGEIIVRGPNVMLGYYKNAEATAEVIDPDGWLHTGDLGVIDAEGHLYIRGRMKNMLLGPDGQNIYTEEAENQITHYTVFDECVVVMRQRRLIALVYASPSSLREAGLTRQELEAQLPDICARVNSHLPKYCQLSALEQRSEEFEKTPKKTIRRFLYK